MDAIARWPRDSRREYKYVKPVRRPARTISVTMRDGTRRTFDDVAVAFETGTILVYDGEVEHSFDRADLTHWSWDPATGVKAR